MRHIFLLNAQGFEDFFVADMIRSILLDVGEQRVGAAFLDDQGSSVLEAVSSGHVAAQVQLLGPVGRRSGLAAQDGGEQVEPAELLEAQSFVRLSLVVDVQLAAVQKLALHLNH